MYFFLKCLQLEKVTFSEDKLPTIIIYFLHKEMNQMEIYQKFDKICTYRIDSIYSLKHQMHRIKMYADINSQLKHRDGLQFGNYDAVFIKRFISAFYQTLITALDLYMT
jgi:hypothetical protein